MNVVPPWCPSEANSYLGPGRGLPQPGRGFSPGILPTGAGARRSGGDSDGLAPYISTNGEPAGSTPVAGAPASTRTMDIISAQRRSANMARIRGRDTAPELMVRRLVHRLGYRFRLHRRDLPGTPDLVFPGRGKVVFVHGCFWHRHESCRFAYEPKSNIEFWRRKFAANQERDARVRGELERMNWQVLTIWECQTADLDALRDVITEFLSHGDR